MENIKVKNVVISKQAKSSENFEKFLEIVRKKKINLNVVNMGDSIKVEKDVRIDILWPDSSNFVEENSLNNNSIVCKFYYKNFSMLFTGDIEKVAEELIVSKYKNNNILKSTVLKVGHHGSKTSSTQEFLETVHPKIAFIGVGENNTFGHPNAEVIERLENLRCKNI